MGPNTDTSPVRPSNTNMYLRHVDTSKGTLAHPINSRQARRGRERCNEPTKLGGQGQQLNSHHAARARTTHQPKDTPMFSMMARVRSTGDSDSTDGVPPR
jgi:hypothetical protein